MNIVTNCRVPYKAGNVLKSLGTVSVSKMTVVYRVSYGINLVVCLVNWSVTDTAKIMYFAPKGCGVSGGEKGSVDQ
jgi:hypothetical protein